MDTTIDGEAFLAEPEVIVVPDTPFDEWVFEQLEGIEIRLTALEQRLQRQLG